MDLFLIAIIFGPPIYTLHACLKCLRDYRRCDKNDEAKRRKLKWQAIGNGVLCLLFSSAVVALYLFLMEALKHM